MACVVYCLCAYLCFVHLLSNWRGFWLWLVCWCFSTLTLSPNVPSQTHTHLKYKFAQSTHTDSGRAIAVRILPCMVCYVSDWYENEKKSISYCVVFCVWCENFLAHSPSFSGRIRRKHSAKLESDESQFNTSCERVLMLYIYSAARRLYIFLHKHPQ